MIKFFRRIRQQLLSQNRLSKYLLYAIGEIILVMIGILLALQVNKWNANKELKENELIFLNKLKDEVDDNIRYLNMLDSLTVTYQDSFKDAFDKFHEIKSVGELLDLGDKFRSQWHDLRFSSTTYDEMVNTGSMYTLENKDLQKAIKEYYDYVKANQSFIETINNTSAQLLFVNDAMFKASYLAENYEKEWFKEQNVDTSWVTNPNSPTYLANYRFFYFSVEADKDRRHIYKGVMSRGKELMASIEAELLERQ